MNSVLFNSASTSSDSSTAGFSSSESDSFYTTTTTARSTSSSPPYTTPRRPNPIRTTSAAGYALPEKSRHVMMENTHKSKSDHKREDHGGFVRTKSKALKIYSDLKKGKQPISPGGRLATFLNSLFTAGNGKKVSKISSSSATNEEQTPTCSSASSFSRSCLSKTPSSRTKSNSNGTKRSVRFCPVSVIVDEDCRPCGHKSLYNQTQFMTESNERVDHDQWRVMEENRRVVQAAKDLLKSYRQNKVEFDMRDHVISHQKKVRCYDNVEEGEEEEDDDDAASCSSSDLFELDNLSAIGIERYSEELPVYETTNLGTNRAIANGLIL